MVSFDDEKKEVKLSLRQADILEALANDAELIAQGGGVPELTRGPDRCVPSMEKGLLTKLTGFNQGFEDSTYLPS